MRVLFLTHQYFPHHVGGTEVLVRGLAERLRDDGHEPFVLTYVESESGHLPDHGFRVTEFEGVPVWELHWNLSVAPHPTEAEYHNPALAELVARAAREIAPDLAHAAHVMKLSAAVVPALKQAGIPLVATLSDYWPLCLRHTLLRPDGVICATGPDHRHRCLACAQATHHFATPQQSCADEAALWEHASRVEGDAAHPDATFRRDVLALARRTETVRADMLAADRIIALSDFQRRMFIQHGYPADRIQVLRHGVETGPLEHVRPSRYRRPQAAGARKVVFMGTLAPHKGAHVLLEAMKQAPDIPILLELFGAPGVDASYVQRLQALAATDPRISFRGVLPPDLMGEALLDAAALAMPALWYENDPLVVKAALYCGVPVAASRIGSLADQLHEPVDGWLLPADDVEAWAAWLRLLSTAKTLPVPPPGAVPTAEEFARGMLSIYRDLAATPHHPR